MRARYSRALALAAALIAIAAIGTAELQARERRGIRRRADDRLEQQGRAVRHNTERGHAPLQIHDPRLDMDEGDDRRSLER